MSPATSKGSRTYFAQVKEKKDVNGIYENYQLNKQQNQGTKLPGATIPLSNSLYTYLKPFYYIGWGGGANFFTS